VCGPTEEIVGQPQKKSLLSRLFHKDEEVVIVGQAAPTTAPPPLAQAPAAVTPTAAPVPTTPPQPSDYHQSWGKVEPARPLAIGNREVVQAQQGQPEPVAPRADPSRPAPTQWRKADPKVVVADPIKDPDWYQKKAVTDLEVKQTGKKDRPGFARATDRPGMASVLSAPGAVAEEGPNAFGVLPSPMPAGAPPGPPDPFCGRQVVHVPPSPPWPMDQGIPSGATNAFTHGGTTRPIPADFGTPQDPSQREWAAECLARQDWRAQPQILGALVTAARVDPAAAVRAGCVRALGKMKANTLPVVQTVQSLKSDRDPRVRQEVDETLAALGAAPESRDGIRPVSATAPADGRLP
jgi:hypothetical protein